MERLHETTNLYIKHLKYDKMSKPYGLHKYVEKFNLAMQFVGLKSNEWIKKTK